MEKKEIVLDTRDIRELLGRMIDIFETMYPLGTVVELKEKFNRSLELKISNIKTKGVIIERFTSMEDKQTYFPYVGNVYPVGSLGTGRFIH